MIINVCVQTWQPFGIFLLVSMAWFLVVFYVIYRYNWPGYIFEHICTSCVWSWSWKTFPRFVTMADTLPSKMGEFLCNHNAAFLRFMHADFTLGEKGCWKCQRFESLTHWKLCMKHWFWLKREKGIAVNVEIRILDLLKDEYETLVMVEIGERVVNVEIRILDLQRLWLK